MRSLTRPAHWPPLSLVRLSRPHKWHSMVWSLQTTYQPGNIVPEEYSSSELSFQRAAALHSQNYFVKMIWSLCQWSSPFIRWHRTFSLQIQDLTSPPHHPRKGAMSMCMSAAKVLHTKLGLYSLEWPDKDCRMRNVSKWYHFETWSFITKLLFCKKTG